MKLGLASLLAGGSILVLAGLSTANAGGFALREQSAYGQGMSFAGVAAGGSLSTMFWNPATLAAVMGFEAEAVGTLVMPRSEVDVFGPVPSSEDDIAQDAFVPAGYAAYRINDRLVLGIGVNAPYGLATKYDPDSLLRAAGVAGTSKIFSTNVNPAVSYQVNDWLAVALGAQIQYAKVRLTNVGPFELEGDDIAAGLTAGVLVTPWAGTEIGLGYRSRINHELEGEMTGPVSLDVTADGLDLPDVVTLGIRQRITDNFRLTAGVEWANWSRFQEVPVSGGLLPFPLPFHYDDSWFFALGGEFDVNDQLTLRAGVGYELSPIDDHNRTFRLPDSDRLWLSAGASYTVNDTLSLDLGYSYLRPKNADLLAAADGGPVVNGPFFGEASGDVHLVSAGLKIRFGGPAAPVFEQPIIVKP